MRKANNFHLPLSKANVPMPQVKPPKKEMKNINVNLQITGIYSCENAQKEIIGSMTDVNAMLINDANGKTLSLRSYNFV